MKKSVLILTGMLLSAGLVQAKTTPATGVVEASVNDVGAVENYRGKFSEWGDWVSSKNVFDGKKKVGPLTITKIEEITHSNHGYREWVDQAKKNPSFQSSTEISYRITAEVGGKTITFHQSFPDNVLKEIEKYIAEVQTGQVKAADEITVAGKGGHDNTPH